MSNTYKKFQTNKEAEQKGVVLDYGDGMCIRIARAGGSNIKFEKAVQSKMRKYELQSKHGLLEPEQMRTIFREVLAETVVLGWEGVTDENGASMTFTKDNAIKLFTDLPDLMDDVLEQSRKVALFRSQIQEEESGN